MWIHRERPLETPCAAQGKKSIPKSTRATDWCDDFAGNEWTLRPPKRESGDPALIPITDRTGQDMGGCWFLSFSSLNRR